MKRILHIVGTFEKRWAISNRAYYLAQIIGEKYKVDVRGKRELPHDVTDYALLHIHSLVIVHQLPKHYFEHPCWGFEVISERNRDHLEREKPFIDKAKFCIIKNGRMGGWMNPHVTCDITEIANGVDTKRFFPRTIRVGWCGNKRPESTEYKGVEIIREAVAQLADDWKHLFRVEFVTDPGDCPKFVLTHKEIAPWYRTLDVYVSASEGEGCSNTTLEALASGVPVVSTETGIAPELAGKCDLKIVDRSVEAIKRGIKDFLLPIQKRRRAMVQQTWRRVAEKYFKLYEQLLGKG